MILNIGKLMEMSLLHGDRAEQPELPPLTVFPDGWPSVELSFTELEINPADRVPLGFTPNDLLNRAQRRAAKRKGRKERR